VAVTTRVEYQQTKHIPKATSIPINFKTTEILNNNLIKEAMILYAIPDIAERAIVYIGFNV